MKTQFLFFLTILSLVGCSKDDPIPPEPASLLPTETQTGANTFGCIINNQVFYPRDGTGTLFSPGGKGFIFWAAPGGTNEYNEIEIKNLKDAKPANTMMIHLQNLNQIGVGEYVWKSSNFQSSIDGLMQNYVYAKIYDESVNGWRLYGSYENSGKVTITKYGNIICGNLDRKSVV